mgnify:CR=1 FL=1
MTKSSPQRGGGNAGHFQRSCFQRLAVDEDSALLPGQRSRTPLQEGHIARDDLIDTLIVHIAAVDPDDLSTRVLIAAYAASVKGPAMSPSAFSVVVIS